MLDLATNLVLLLADAACLALAARGRPVAGAVIAFGCASAAVTALALFGSTGAFGAMRGLSWLLFVHTPVALGAGAVFARGRPRDALLLGVTALGLVVVGIDAFVVEPRWLQVRTVVIETDELQEPLRIVVVSDLQTDRVGDFERRVFDRATELGGDLILLPGDFVQASREDHPAQVAAFRALLPRLQAPLGVWAVQGNSERPGWAEDLFGGTHVRASEHTTTVDLGLLTLSALSFADGFDRSAVLPAEPGLHVAFAHSPDFSLSEGVGADVLLAGHTHGGQVQVPLFGPLLTLSWVSRSAAAGVPTRLGGDRWLVVSRGVGMERGHAPRLRFWCRPELVVVDLVPRRR